MMDDKRKDRGFRDDVRSASGWADDAVCRA